MIPALVIFALTYVLMLIFGKYRPYILSMGICQRNSLMEMQALFMIIKMWNSTNKTRFPPRKKNDSIIL